MDEIKYTEQQEAAIEMVFKSRVSILTGKPGTGKTTTILGIIQKAREMGIKITQAAPTGKAAKRMQEATECDSSTIHSMLQPTFDTGAFKFSVNEENPLKCGLLILDECSMITTELLSSVMKAIDTRRTRVLFVGDTGQLPSIGGGAVLRDMIESAVIPHVELDIIHRNSGRIVEACASIHAGKSYPKDTVIDLEAKNKVNLVHVECSDPEMIQTTIKNIVADRMPVRGYDPVWHVQIISPVNSKGMLSCEAINEVLRDRLNPSPYFESPPPANQKTVFRRGDKIINTKNLKLSEPIINGDIGEIQDVTEKHYVVQFFDPDRLVEIERRENYLLHAYCITCHRFQGSESPVIIIPVHSSFTYFVNRSWIYTAISRARELCITVGDFSSIARMIDNTRDTRRFTRLKERILHSHHVLRLTTEYEGV